VARKLEQSKGGMAVRKFSEEEKGNKKKIKIAPERGLGVKTWNPNKKEEEKVRSLTKNVGKRMALPNYKKPGGKTNL